MIGINERESVLKKQRFHQDKMGLPKVLPPKRAEELHDAGEKLAEEKLLLLGVEYIIEEILKKKGLGPLLQKQERVQVIPDENRLFTSTNTRTSTSGNNRFLIAANNHRLSTRNGSQRSATSAAESRSSSSRLQGLYGKQVSGEINAPFAMKVFPNPTTDFLQVQGVSKPMALYTQYGQWVRTIIANDISHEARVDVSDLPSGQYFLTSEDQVIPFSIAR